MPDVDLEHLKHLTGRKWRTDLGFRTNLVVIEGNLNAQRYRDEVLARHLIPLCRN